MHCNYWSETTIFISLIILEKLSLYHYDARIAEEHIHIFHRKQTRKIFCSYVFQCCIHQTTL